jgi:protein-S-isoprenylcysteine O-methyltransferase Ste14
MAPGVVMGLIPWLLTRWEVREPLPYRVLMRVLGGTLLVAAFVRFYEESTLTWRFGADYETYRRAVPAWWPRLRTWKPSERDETGAR